MNARLHSRVFLRVAVCVGIVIMAGFALVRATAQDAPANSEVRKLAEDQLALAKRALGLIDRSARIGAPVANAAIDVHAWSYRRLGAKLFLTFGPDEPKTMDPEVYLIQAQQGPPNPDRIAAFEEHRDLMKSWEARFRGLAQSGVGSQFDYLTFQAHFLQAEIWLARERNRKPGQEMP